jgi:3-hydroxyacyl-CoA dehydrogenase/enoyl-CoA hydratase/3-hydroxybutyryl-CoA epimerase
VVAAINGAALGGGLELALAAHHRIAADVPGCQVGFPEVGLGLLPAAGGVVRSVRHLGVTEALEKLLLPGKAYGPAEAAGLGLIDELVSDVGELIPKAKEWIAANPDAAQPWDRPGFAIPGGTPARGPLAAQLPFLSANLRSRTKGAPAPAERAILAAAVEGDAVDLDSASLIETRYFVGLAAGQLAKNKINGAFFDLQHIKSGASRPAGVPAFRSARLGVVGAGMMGAGIAYAAARAGIDVVLTDVTLAGAEKGKAYSARLVAKAVTSGRSTQAEADALLARIRPTADLADLAGADFVVEAVFENAELKAAVFGQVEQAVGADAVLGSNTSTLPITALARAVTRPADFVGVHFFSPVDRMPPDRADQGRADFARDTGAGVRPGQAARQNPDRGQRQPRVLHQPGHHRPPRGGRGHGGRGHRAGQHRAGRAAVGLPGGTAATARRAHPDPPALRAQRGEGGRRGEGARGIGAVDGAPVGRGLRPADRRVRPDRPGRRRRVLRLRLPGPARRALARAARAFRRAGRPATARPATARPATARTAAGRPAAVRRPEGTAAVRRSPRGLAGARVRGDRLGRGRQRRLAPRHRLPGVDRGSAPLHREYDGGPAGFARRAAELADRYGARFTPPASLPASLAPSLAPSQGAA